MSSTQRLLLKKCFRRPSWIIQKFGATTSSSSIRNSNRRRLFSTAASSFAIVDHSKAYENAMEGRHGNQLELTELDGLGKDDPDFDPSFYLDMLELNNDDKRLEEEDYGDDGIEEAEYTEKEGKSNTNELSEEDYEEDDGDDSDEEEEDDDDEYGDDYYNNDGSVPYSKSQLATFKAGGPAGGMFAVIELSGTQHKVTVDDVIVSHLLKPLRDYPIGSIIECEDVLLIASSHQTLVGMPTLQGRGASVKLMVEEITLDKKVVVFKKRRRKNSQRKNGFRRRVMMLRVLDIQFPQTSIMNEKEYVPRVEPITDRIKPDTTLVEDDGATMQEECA